ncbi:Choline-phosphate cytidylyltransferase [Nakaseomyces bracarensis]|uniref:choline-phosphate cytidylyltransferase n=1 Tax=Nakaseomyces bracarensis TaxID=273131 RepID=A0ABR4NR27_9SACH
MAKISRTTQLKKRLSNSSLSKLFKGKRRREDDESDSSVGNNNNSDTVDEKENREIAMPSPKRRRAVSKEQIEFEKREAELDAELPEELRKYRPKGFHFNIPPKDRPIRVYADGIFDLFHLGHMKQLEQCKKAFPNVELVCGVPSDEVTHRLKGLTVLTDKQRCETLKHCKWVDEVIPDAPWCVTPEFLAEHKIDYVAHDDIPYVSTDSDDIYKPIKELGKFLTTQRTGGISTSDIITKIIRDYDKYLMRNFARGATRQELNVSWLKKNELEFKKHINDFRSYFKKNQGNLNSTSRDLYFEVREILLRKTLGKKLYSKLLGDKNIPRSLALGSLSATSDEDEQSDEPTSTTKAKKLLIREPSPATEFANKYTGSKVQQSESESSSEDEE